LTPPASYAFPADHACFQVDFHVRTNAFVQTNGTIYWLDVQALLPPPGPGPAPAFGWKTSTFHWNDDAVWVNAMEPYEGNGWKDLHYPPGHQFYPASIDLAFRLASQQSVYQLKWTQRPVNSVSNRVFVAEWNAENGILYQLRATYSVSGSTLVWTNIGPIVLGPANSQMDQNISTQKFYRVHAPFAAP
jgi:hypothetical protein